MPHIHIAPRSGSFLTRAQTVTIGGLKGVTHAVGHFFLPAATATLAAISIWEEKLEARRIRNEYQDEIAAKLGKSSSHINVNDMEKVAKENPALHEAVRRNTIHRNLSIGVTVAAAATALFLAPALVPTILTGTALHVMAGVISFGSYLAVEHGLTRLGEKAFNLEEPGLASVRRGKAGQGELSVPSQVTYLAQLQAQNITIRQEQVLTLFASARPEVAAAIAARYGKPLDKLDARAKADALGTFGAQYNVAEWTDALNRHEARAQELAFASYGQSSSGAAPVSAAAPDREEAAQQEDAAWRKRLEAERSQPQGRLAAMGV